VNKNVFLQPTTGISSDRSVNCIFGITLVLHLAGLFTINHTTPPLNLQVSKVVLAFHRWNWFGTELTVNKLHTHTWSKPSVSCLLLYTKLFKRTTPCIIYKLCCYIHAVMGS